jgi:hypothetical protein
MFPATKIEISDPNHHSKILSRSPDLLCMSCHQAQTSKERPLDGNTLGSPSCQNSHSHSRLLNLKPQNTAVCRGLFLMMQTLEGRFLLFLIIRAPPYGGCPIVISLSVRVCVRASVPHEVFRVFFLHRFI